MELKNDFLSFWLWRTVGKKVFRCLPVNAMTSCEDMGGGNQWSATQPSWSAGWGDDQVGLVGNGVWYSLASIGDSGKQIIWEPIDLGIDVHPLELRCVLALRRRILWYRECNENWLDLPWAEPKLQRRRTNTGLLPSWLESQGWLKFWIFRLFI